MGNAAFKTDKMRRIEAQLERDRVALGASIEALGRTMPANVAGTARDGISSAAAAVVGGRGARPLALALASMGLGLGLARHRRMQGNDPQGDALAGSRFEALSRWEDEGGPVMDAAEFDRSENQTVPTTDPGADWMPEVDRLRDRASALLARIDRAVRLRLAPASELAAHRAEVVSALFRDTNRVMATGLEHLSDEALQKAVKAREEAYDAQLRLRETGSSMIRERPFLSGAILAAVGAGIASALRTTEAENRILGPARDNLVRTAKAVANAEGRRLGQAASALFETLKTDIARAETTVREKEPDTH
ncbi:MAG: hypothetical protein ACRCSU_01445 [Paracoccaceae bacterium]